MSNFIEEELERAALEWFEELAYEIAYGPEISPQGDYPEREEYTDVILEERLRDALYEINKGIPREGIEEAIRKVKIPQNPALIINNKEMQKMITDGIDVSYRENGEIKYDKVWLFHEEPLDNDFLACNQFTVIESTIEKRPDIIVFINGIPFVIIELKSSSDEETGISEGYNSLQTYKTSIPYLFTYNAFMISSDGINARVGTLTAGEDRFMMWRTIDGIDLAPATIPQLEVLIKGMLDKRVLLELIKDFIVFHTDGYDTKKILAGYHQYYAVKKASRSTERAVKETGDRRIGVVWHTQGSGKSLSMVFYAGKLVSNMDNPTIVVITDRNDLDDQLYSTFAASKDLLRQEPVQAESRKDLRELLAGRDSGGIIFTTIHKFAPDEGEDIKELTGRRNVIVIADEAHRSQYGFNAKVSTGSSKANIKYGFAKYMRDALPNASFIGFTGTPVELTDKNTPAVFGEYIDVYDMSQAVEDEMTVKIYYESRIAKLELPDEMKAVVDEEYDEITEYQESEQREKLKSKWSRLEAIVGTEKRVALIAKDIVEHYEKRQQASFGKAMIVCMSRRICADLYEEIVSLRPEWHSDDDTNGLIKVVMTGSSADEIKLQPHICNKKRSELLAKRMRDEKDELKIVIVCDMWLTGFDVPSLNTMYIDKPMNGHNLMQAIARVNRVFKDKQGGLVVDYIGIADNLKRALSRYTETDRQQTGVETHVAVQKMLEKYDVIKDILHGHNYDKFFAGKSSERMAAIVETIDFILEKRDEELKKDFIKYTIELAQAYSLCATTEEAEKLNDEIAFFKAVKSGIIKMIPVNSKKLTSSQLDARLNQLISKSIMSEEVVDILGAVGLNKANIGILSDEFLEEVKGLKHKNLAVELLQRLLKGKVKEISTSNLIQSRKFSEMLENTIIRYQNRAIETTQVILELIELAKEMNEAYKRGEETGLSSDEVAFYDALADNDSAQEVLGDDILKQIAIDLTDSIKRSMSVDWNLRESVRAKMRMTIRRLLRQYGYPPDQQPKAIDTVMKQAELMCSNEVSYYIRGERSFDVAADGDNEY